MATHGEVQRGPGAKRYESGVGEDINTKQGCIGINMEKYSGVQGQSATNLGLEKI